VTYNANTVKNIALPTSNLVLNESENI
jgi:hypothetical protein